ncbi:predicted protein [Histoplasma capsulatum G186AR]|uniref:Uncharacterized protein n=1 Tax=Ajellomyces capsulatus (strain G186AR / H82 / ATCC MYA-2454 / RMSCC 2432) TaxID=447093 RepID=C0NV67_AJECG|nr:uncharacterized protein HCBG_06831 [Histoplasma capsulatum G186AR]EEH04880.1 predicted protein [Histoplasma capsulatum G186AR]
MRITDGFQTHLKGQQEPGLVNGVGFVGGLGFGPSHPEDVLKGPHRNKKFAGKNDPRITRGRKQPFILSWPRPHPVHILGGPSLELTQEKAPGVRESDPPRPKQEPRFVSKSAAVKQHQAGILCLVRRLLDASWTTGGSSVRGVSKRSEETP